MKDKQNRNGPEFGPAINNKKNRAPGDPPPPHIRTPHKVSGTPIRTTTNTCQMASLRIATLNINIITSLMRITMLEDFLRTWEIDALLTQEVTQPVLHTIRGYSTLYNIGTEGRGTAIIARDAIHLVNVARLHSGRAIAAKFRDIALINIYAPS